MVKDLRMVIARAAAAVAASWALGAGAADYDLVIYGGTPAGISAAVQAKRMGLKAVLIEPTSRIGGLTTGGLGRTDIGTKETFGGITREFYAAVADWYRRPENWTRETREEFAARTKAINDKRFLPDADTIEPQTVHFFEVNIIFFALRGNEFPGLGAEITNHEKFQVPFAGKKVSKNGEIALSVVKHGNVKDAAYEVDGLSGATFTSTGVSNMLKDILSCYSAFLGGADAPAEACSEAKACGHACGHACEHECEETVVNE